MFEDISSMPQEEPNPEKINQIIYFILCVPYSIVIVCVRTIGPTHELVRASEPPLTVLSDLVGPAASANLVVRFSPSTAHTCKARTGHRFLVEPPPIQFAHSRHSIEVRSMVRHNHRPVDTISKFL